MRLLRRRRESSGHALAMALLILVLVGTASGAVALILQLENRASLEETRRVHLVALTDAALAEALAELDRSPRFRGTPEHAVGSGTISSEVKVVRSNVFEVSAKGTYRGAVREVRAEVSVLGSHPRVLSWRVAQ